MAGICDILSLWILLFKNRTLLRNVSIVWYPQNQRSFGQNLELNCENILQLHNWIESVNDSFNHYLIRVYVFVSLLT